MQMFYPVLPYGFTYLLPHLGLTEAETSTSVCELAIKILNNQK